MSFRGYYFLAPLLGHLVVGGCTGSDAPETEPTVTQTAEASFLASSPTVTCDQDTVLARVGEPARLRVQSRYVTATCQCETTSSGWGCGGKICASEYDLGHPNTPMCTSVDGGPASFLRLDAHVDRTDCTVTAVMADDDPGVVIVTVQCRTPGTVHVIVGINTESGGLSVEQALFFSGDGTCAPPRPSVDDDAGVLASDASASTDDAGDATDAGIGEGGD